MKAFTLIEILIVIGMLAILTGLVFPLSFNFYRNQQIETNTQGIIQTLRRAQLKAMAVENGSSFGIYLTDDNYTLFKGDSYLARDVQYDEASGLSPIVTVSSLSEVVFSKLAGIPSATGTVVLNNGIESRNIGINEVGRINLE